MRRRDLLMKSGPVWTFAAARYRETASSAGKPTGQTRSFRPFPRTRTDSV